MIYTDGTLKQRQQKETGIQHFPGLDTIYSPGKRSNNRSPTAEQLSSSYIQQPLDIATNQSSPSVNSIMGSFVQQATGVLLQNQASPCVSPVQNQYFPPTPVSGTQGTFQTQGCLAQSLGDSNSSAAIMQTMFGHTENRMKGMDSKLNKLDSIENQVLKMKEKVSSMDRRVTSLETRLTESNRQLFEIQASRAFDSQTSDEIKTAQTALSKQLTGLATVTDELARNLVCFSGERAIKRAAIRSTSTPDEGQSFIFQHQ